MIYEEMGEQIRTQFVKYIDENASSKTGYKLKCPEIGIIISL